MPRIALVTSGNPNRCTGGYLYHLRMAELAPRFDAHINFVSFPEWRFPLPALAAFRVRGQIKALKPDVILVDSIAAAYAVTALVRLHLPVVAILHQPPGGVGQGRRIQRGLDLSLYRRALLLVAASRSLARELEGHGFETHRFREIPPGRDVGDASAFAVRDLREGRACAFLCVANWLEHKGIVDLLEAFALLPAEAGTLHLAGDVDCDPVYRRRIERKLSRPELSERVVVHGQLPRGHVAALYRDADVFVLPSYEEAYGTVYGEALAEGLPIIGWQAGNLPNLIDDGVEGLALPPGDVSKLAEALERLARDPARRGSMARAAARRGSALPTWQETAAELFASIQQVADEKSSSGYARTASNVLQ